MIIWKELRKKLLKLLLLTDWRQKLYAGKCTFKLLAGQINQIVQIRPEHLFSVDFIFIPVFQGDTLFPVRIADPAFYIVKHGDIFVLVIFSGQCQRIIPKHELCPVFQNSLYANHTGNHGLSLVQCNLRCSIRKAYSHGGIGASKVNDQRQFCFYDFFFLYIQQRNLDTLYISGSRHPVSIVTVIEKLRVSFVWKVEDKILMFFQRLYRDVFAFEKIIAPFYLLYIKTGVNLKRFINQD